jgi:hypothetical protein
MESVPGGVGPHGRASRRLAEEQPEAWTRRTELRRRGHREVELERVREQEHAVDRRTDSEIGELHGPELVDQLGRPVVEHLIDRDGVGDAEGEVEVGEAVAAVDREGTDDGARDDAVIALREPEDPRAERISLLDGEHLVWPPLLRAADVVRGSDREHTTSEPMSSQYGPCRGTLGG